MTVTVTRDGGRLTVTFPTGTDEKVVQQALCDFEHACLSEGICWRCARPLTAIALVVDSGQVGGTFPSAVFPSACYPCGWAYRRGPTDMWEARLTLRGVPLLVPAGQL